MNLARVSSVGGLGASLLLAGALSCILEVREGSGPPPAAGDGGRPGVAPPRAPADAAPARDAASAGPPDAPAGLRDSAAPAPPDAPPASFRDAAPVLDAAPPRDQAAARDVGPLVEAGSRAACEALEREFQSAWRRALACSPGAPNQCQTMATSGTVRCPLCPVYVHNAAEVTRLRNDFRAMGCEAFYVQPCPVAACVAPTPGRCVPTDAGAAAGECLF